ncbi:MAG: radical SAM protein [Promethearchaeota archaeon]
MSGLASAGLRFAYRLVSRFYLRNPHMSDWLHERYQRLGTFCKLAANLAFHVARRNVTPFLLTVNLDPVNRCNLRCKTCRGYYDFPPDDEGMPYSLFTRVLRQIPASVENVNLSMYGEPLLHPQILRMVSDTARRGFRPTMFTNGTLVDGPTAKALLSSPLHALTLSMDVSEPTSLEWRGVSHARLEGVLRLLLRTKAELRSPVKVKVSLVSHPGNAALIPKFLAKWEKFVDGFKVSPFISRGKRTGLEPCSELWRGNLTVFSNGDVAPCCGDFGRQLVVGSLRDRSLWSIWTGPELRELRARHLRGDLGEPCSRCVVDSSGGLRRFR